MLQAFRQQMLDKFARDDNIEQMTAQKRRLKQQDHKRAVEDLIEGVHEREFDSFT